MISDAFAGRVSVPVGLVFAQSPESTQAPHVGYFCASLTGFDTVLLGTHHLRPPAPTCPMHAGILGDASLQSVWLRVARQCLMARPSGGRLARNTAIPKANRLIRHEV